MAAWNDEGARLRAVNEGLADFARGDSVFLEELEGLADSAALGILSAVAITEIGVPASTLAIIALLGAGMGLASGIAIGAILGLAVVGLIKPNEQEVKTIKFVGKLTGSPFATTMGAVGLAIDGEYGFATGVTIGDFVSNAFDVHDEMSAYLSSSSNQYERISHYFGLMHALSELPRDEYGERVPWGHAMWSEHLNSDAIPRDLEQYRLGLSWPALTSLVQAPSPTAAQDRATDQIRQDRAVLPPVTSSPHLPAPQAPSSAQIAKVPPSFTSPAPRPTPQPQRLPAPNNSPLIPDNLGGGDPTGGGDSSMPQPSIDSDPNSDFAEPNIAPP
jgi:hypothetical protein